MFARAGKGITGKWDGVGSGVLKLSWGSQDTFCWDLEREGLARRR